MGRFTELRLLKNERIVNAMDSPWDDGELASPRRGEAKPIGEHYPFKVFFFREKRVHDLGVVHYVFKFPRLITATLCLLKKIFNSAHTLQPNK